MLQGRHSSTATDFGSPLCITHAPGTSWGIKPSIETPSLRNQTLILPMCAQLQAFCVFTLCTLPPQTRSDPMNTTIYHPFLCFGEPLNCVPTVLLEMPCTGHACSLPLALRMPQNPALPTRPYGQVALSPAHRAGVCGGGGGSLGCLGDCGWRCDEIQGDHSMTTPLPDGHSPSSSKPLHHGFRVTNHNARSIPPNTRA